MKVGIFDSGMGGLFVMKSLYDKFPENEFVYYGDTLHLPYGNKTVEQLESYARNIIRFLQTKETDLIIVACNTISATLLPEVMQFASPIPLFNVLTPTVRETIAGARKRKAEKIVVIGTPTMIRSGTYSRLIREQLSEVRIEDFATPEFVPMIEAGKTKTEEMQKIITHYFSPHKDADIVVLGCTHYDAVSENIREFYRRNSLQVPTLVSSASSILKDLPRLVPSSSSIAIFTSSPAKDFEKLANSYFPKTSVRVENVHNYKETFL